MTEAKQNRIRLKPLNRTWVTIHSPVTIEEVRDIIESRRPWLEETARKLKEYMAHINHSDKFKGFM